ncbi:MAG: universal stress protein [Saprospiraceae bacterium]
MKSILVPIDFSRCAGNALQFALRLAGSTGAEVTVLHVIFPNEGVDNNVYNAFWSDEYLSERTKSLSAWANKYQRKTRTGKVPVRAECRIGFPVSTICDMADDVYSDLIVMGTTGATGLHGAFLGSIAAGVLSKTKRPLLSIPKQAANIDLSASAVFATDFHFRLGDLSAAVLHEMLTPSKGKLHVVHIMDKPGEERDTAREKSFGDKLGGVPHDFHYLHDRDIAQAISNFMESVDGGLLIAVAHEHSVLHRLFFDSITRRLAHRVHVAMLTLHDAV